MKIEREDEMTTMKGKQTHTPGPWELSHDLGTVISVAKEVAPNCGRLLLIADVHKGKQNWGEVSGSECDANASLIAAAPELLTALRRLRNSPDVNLDELSPETIKALDDADSAIAKAEGNPQ